jgi:hypothetical protein
MGQIVIATAGAAIGFVVSGGNPYGAMIGWSLGAALSGNQGNKSAGPAQQLTDLTITGTAYGQPIPYVRGLRCVSGETWWNTDRRPHTTTTGGGKGGGGPPAQSTTTYDMDIMIGLADNVQETVLRIWMNGLLVYNVGPTADAATISASLNNKYWSRMTFYDGSDTQLPDPTYEAVVGSANAPAYRGRCYVFIQGLQLGTSGAVPNFTFEIGTPPLVDLPPGTVMELIQANAGNFFAGGVYQSRSFENTGAYIWSGQIYQQSNAQRLSSRDITTDPSIAFRHLRSGLMSYSITGSKGNLATVNEATGVYTRVYQDSAHYLYQVAAPFGLSGNLYCIVGNAGLIDRIRRIASGGAGAVTDFAMTSNTRPELLTYKLTGGGSGVTLWSVTEQAIYNITAVDGITMTQLYNTGYDTNGQTAIGLDYYAPLDKVIINGGGNYCIHDVATQTSGSHVNFSHTSTWVFDANRYGFWGIASSGRLYFHDIASNTETEETQFYTYWTANFPGYSWNSQVGSGDNGLIYVRGTTGGGIYDEFVYVPVSVLPDGVAISDLVSDLMVRAGLSTSQFDVSALSAIQKRVRSLAISRIEATRLSLEQLMSCFFFELTTSDKIYFRPRGGSTVATIPTNDLGAEVYPRGNVPEPLPIVKANDLELPAQTALTYPNVDFEYQPDTQYSDRLISTSSGTINAITVTIGMRPSEAKGVADVMMLDQAASVITAAFSVMGQYLKLEPTDPVVVTGPDGTQYRMRLVKMTDSYPLLKYDAVLDDVSVLSSQAITGEDYTTQTVVTAIPDTLMDLLDIPILQDADNDAGFYSATKGDGTPYSGSAVFSSSDGVNYTLDTFVNESGIFGTCTTTLGDWAGGRVFDEKNSVTVDVGVGTLASSTRSAVLSSASINAMLIGNELIQFRTATVVSTGVYKLAGLLRGSRGTEWAMTGHSGSERAVLLQSSGIRRIESANALIGITRYYKGVTQGAALASASPVSFIDTGVGLKPFSPFDLRGVRDGSNNLTITWQRRSRLSVRMIGPLGISVPLGEGSEAYQIDIYSDGTYTTVVRTISITTTTAEYSAADQTGDGLTPGNPVYMAVYQMSVQVGRGYQLKGAV